MRYQTGMCTVVLLRRPEHAWPLILAANRDEMITRPWLAPARHWPDRAQVVAGIDTLAGGTWCGVNDYGVTATILNRENTLGPLPGKRSRGELVLEALDHADADQAARALVQLNPDAYRPFNMVIADNRDAFWLVHRGDGKPVQAVALPPGLSMITAHDLNDAVASARTRRYRPLFQAATPPDPDQNDWAQWQDLLAARHLDQGSGPRGAMCVDTGDGFTTICSSLIALPAAGRADVRPVWRFAAGRPDQVAFQPVVFDLPS